MVDIKLYKNIHKAAWMPPSQIHEIDDIQSLREWQHENITGKIRDEYEKILKDNNLNPLEYEPLVTFDTESDIGMTNEDFINDKYTIRATMKIQVNAKKKS